MCAVYQNMNQFQQGAMKGDLYLPSSPTISVQLHASATTVYPGSAVKLYAGTSNTILVDKAGANDDIFGWVIRNPKKTSFAAGDTLEVALTGSVITVESSAAFERGQQLEFVATNDLVKAFAGSNTPVGVALDKATAANQLIRMFIKSEAEYSSSSSSSSCRSSSSSSSSSAA